MIPNFQSHTKKRLIPSKSTNRSTSLRVMNRETSRNPYRMKSGITSKRRGRRMKKTGGITTAILLYGLARYYFPQY